MNNAYDDADGGNSFTKEGAPWTTDWSLLIPLLAGCQITHYLAHRSTIFLYYLDDQHINPITVG